MTLRFNKQVSMEVLAKIKALNGEPVDHDGQTFIFHGDLKGNKPKHYHGWLGPDDWVSVDVHRKESEEVHLTDRSYVHQQGRWVRK